MARAIYGFAWSGGCVARAMYGSACGGGVWLELYMALHVGGGDLIPKLIVGRHHLHVCAASTGGVTWSASHDE